VSSGSLPIQTFDLSGPAWLNIACFGIGALFIVPIGAVFIYGGYCVRRLWRRAKARGYDDRRLARVAARMGLVDQFKDAGSLERFRTRPRSPGLSDIALGSVLACFGICVVVWGPLQGPARLQITGSELIVNYRWPRPDRRVPIAAVTAVDYHTVLYRGRRRAPRSATSLIVTIRDGKQFEIKPTDADAQWENLRAAGVVLAERANVRLDETVTDNR
jgi:hypothetical protein